MKILNVVGARPNFMKISPLMREFKKHSEIDAILIHTGQHYDKNMSESFFRDLEIPEPDYNLGVGSGSHSEQTAKIMIEFEKICLKENPDLILVVGDVNSTIACSLVAAKLEIKIAHVEAGLRSFDNEMPEEINRILTDRISNYLFITEPSGIKNLKNEGVPDEKIFHVGNVMIDTLKYLLNKINQTKTNEKYNLDKETYAVLTLHRPSNVDNKDNFSNILEAIEAIQEKIKIIFPLHPRTKKRIEEFGFENRINSMKNLIITEPLDYLNFMNLVVNSKMVLTDSGGIQEETTFLQIPCITLRENTERPITIEIGSNILVGIDRYKIIEESLKVLNNKSNQNQIPELWDGNAAERIVKILKDNQNKNG